MFAYYNKVTRRVDLTWSQAVELALNEVTQEYNIFKDAQLYMYNPVGSDPIPLDDLEHTLMTTGKARIEAGHFIELLVTINGKRMFDCLIYRNLW